MQNWLSFGVTFHLAFLNEASFPNETSVHTPLNISWLYVILCHFVHPTIVPRLTSPIHRCSLSLAAALFYFHSSKTCKTGICEWKKNKSDALTPFAHKISVQAKIVFANGEENDATNSLTYFHLFNRFYIYLFVYFSLSFYFFESHLPHLPKDDTVGLLLLAQLWRYGVMHSFSNVFDRIWMSI